MDNKSKILLERFRHYIQGHYYFDIVETKFGLVKVVMDHGVIEVHDLPDFQSILDTLIHEVVSDIFDDKTITDKKAEARRRLLPFFSGLEFQGECEAAIDAYFARGRN